MEGEKERESEKGEEKENDEAEDSDRVTEGAALPCEEGSSDLPIMHWEALSLRIAELEKQEEERKERLKSLGVLERGSVSAGWMKERERGSWSAEWDDTEDRSRRIMALTSRFHNQKNLQLCFINNSESEDEEEEEDGVGTENSREGVADGHGPSRQAPPPANADKGKRTRGLKMEVRATLSALRDKLWAEQREKERLACCDTGIKRKPLELSDLQNLSLQQLDSLRASLNQAIHDLSSELVSRLLMRDQLRTEQDAMLLDVEDMTSL
ncbi:hypothetical protein MATL_G00045580 [Megalops atlanticus]|uniref:Schwannomin interacting protein 1 C-terminal domain-containing protein n=1 Tax=Megalops atlanticus TaxID=7932 RepID=A0A9D3TEN4_MEGAT|nr:hypothetical protein MATL_G00045580 [Megalops atlanticus]